MTEVGCCFLVIGLRVLITIPAAFFEVSLAFLNELLFFTYYQVCNKCIIIIIILRSKPHNVKRKEKKEIFKSMNQDEATLLLNYKDLPSWVSFFLLRFDEICVENARYTSRRRGAALPVRLG